MGTKAYQVRVATRGATTVAGNVDFTLSTTLAEAPTIPGQTVDPIRGQTRSRPWSVQVVDSSGAITGHLGDGDGRMHLLGRLMDLQVNEDGAGMATVATGRLAHLSEGHEPKLWKLEVEDERWVERNARIFTVADTTQVYPAGLRYGYRGFQAGETQPMAVSAVRGNMVLLEIQSTSDAAGAMPSDVQSLITADVKTDTSLLTTATTGNFNTLRASVSGTDREVLGFGYTLTFGDTVLTPVLGADQFHSTLPVAALWVVWPTSQPSVGARYDVALTMAAHEPTPSLPLHVGVTDASHDYGTAAGGIHPFELVSRLYDEAGVRYDSTVMNALIADTRYPKVYFRITAPQNLAQWLEDNIYGPLSVVPFINAAGEVAPKAVHLPEDLDPDTLTELTAANQSEQPTFVHTRREIVNRIVFKVQNESLQTTGDNRAADGIRVVETTLERDHDNQAELGVFPLEVKLYGFHRRTGTFGFSGDSIFTSPRERIADYLSREVFDRFGDGPITGRIVGLSGVDDVQPGDFVLMNLATYPNPSDNDRGSERILQILSKDLTPAGPEFDYLDAGPYLQPLASPTVSIIKNTARPTNDVDVTVADVVAGATATIQLAYNATEPAADSSLWFVARSGVADDATVTIPDNPTGAHVWARARSTAVGRIRSGWSAVDDVTLDSAANVRNPQIAFDASGIPTVTWEYSSGTVGVRLIYGSHFTFDATSLPESDDFDATLGTATLSSFPIEYTEYLTVEVEPYTGFSGGSVTGTGGTRARVTTRREYVAEPEHVYDILRLERINRTDGGLSLKPIFGAKVQAVLVYDETFELPLTGTEEIPDDTAPDAILTSGDSHAITAPAPGFWRIVWFVPTSGSRTGNVRKFEIGPAQIPTDGIDDHAVNGDKIADAALDRAALFGAQVVETAAIKLRAVGQNQIALQGVHRENVIDKTLDAIKLADTTLTLTEFTRIVADEAVPGAKFASATLDLTEFSRVVADNAIVAGKLSVNELSEIADDVGIVVSGELRNAAGTRYIDLDASGVEPFIMHENFEIRADGDAFFRGELVAVTGTFVGSLDTGATSNVALSALNANIGTITAGVLQNEAGVNYIDLNATGTDVYIKCASALEILANGDATFTGTLSATAVDGSLTVPAVDGQIDFRSQSGATLWGRLEGTENINGRGFILKAMDPSGGGDPDTAADYASLTWQSLNGTGKGTLGVEGGIAAETMNLSNLPTSDPGVPGQLWRSGTDLMVSV